MTKSELIASLAAHSTIAVKDAECAVRLILEAMTEAVTQGRRIEIRGFGRFAHIQRASRVGRNPKSGQRVEIPEKQVLHFKPGKDLRERVACWN